MIPASTIQNTTFLYRNRIREIAYAAMLAVSTVSRAVIAEVMKLAPYHLRMSVFCRVFVKASSVGFSIAQVVLVVSAFGFRAVSSAQARGTSQSSAKAISTPAQIRLKSLTRVWTSGGVAWAPVPGRSSVVAAMSGLLLLRADKDEPGGGHGKHHQEEEHRQGRGIADPEVREALVVDVLQHRAGGEVRAARRHDVHLVEHLERRDDLQHHHERRGARQQRDGDHPDLLPRSGTV